MGTSWATQGLSNPIEAFRKTFPGRSPTHFSRAPGRVNLIGDHTDYNGLPVLPMALNREVRMLFSPRSDQTVQVRNWEDEFDPIEFSISPDIPPGRVGGWGNYLKSALPGTGPPGRTTCSGLDALVSSDLPIASGLSSSSALVVAMGQAVLTVNGLSLPMLEFAEDHGPGGTIYRNPGRRHGPGHCRRRPSGPCKPNRVRSPSTLSTRPSRRTGSSSSPTPWSEQRNPARLRISTIAEQGSAKKRWDSFETLSRMLSGSVTNPYRIPGFWIRSAFKSWSSWERAGLEGELLKRFRHVVTEGTRVYDAEQALKNEDRLTFGLLMNASHESLRDDFEVSCPELNCLVELALEAGADGARLTGAGFGGCIVALTEPNRVWNVMEALKEGYYHSRTLDSPLHEVLFVAEPSDGATVFQV